MDFRIVDREACWSVVLAAAIFLGLYLTSLYNYLLFHSMVEIFSIVIGCGLFLIAWNARQFLKNNYLLFIGVAYLFVAAIDLAHMLAYKGMGVFPGFDANLPTQLWIAARYMQSVSLVIAPLFIKRKLRDHLVFAFFFAAFALLLALIFYWRIFPACYVEGSGLTTFKIVSEYLICLILLAALVLLFAYRREFEPKIFWLIVGSMIFTIGSEFAFTLYISVFGLANLIGHYLKVIAFYLVYRAVIETGLKEPFAVLFRELESERQALGESAAAYKNLVENLNDIVFKTDIHGVLTYVAPPVQRLLGYEPSELIDRPFPSVLHPDDVGQFSRSLREVLAKRVHPSDFRFRTKSGEYRWLRSSSRPVVEDDRVVGIQGIATDITERKRAEEALQKSYDELNVRVLERTAEMERANRALQEEIAERKEAEAQIIKAKEEWERTFDAITDPIMILDTDHRIVKANHAMAAKLGISPEEATGLACFECVHGCSEPPAVCPHARLLIDKQPHTSELHDERMGGDFLVSVSPLYGSDGTLFGSVHYARDITEQKLAQEAVKAERQRLYDVLETLPVYVCLLNEDYRMPFANRYFRETFGESQGRRCHDFLFNRTEPCEVCETYTVMKTRAPHHWYWTGPNGRDYDIYDFPFTDTDGSFLILEMGIDITERKKAEEALKQTLDDLTRSNADLQHFAYVASHDLQEPLRSVASALYLFEKKHKGTLDGESDQLIHYAVDASRKMKALILDLLTYSRVTTRGQPFERVNVQEVVNQSVLNLKGLIDDKKPEITCDEMPAVQADFTQLLQVFQNLIGNAVKYGPSESPKVHVSAERRDNEWIFSVQDNGIGITAEYFDRIFIIFQQLNKKGPFHGTGMGLAIVKRIVERHRGRVWVESEVGVGSTFYFTIPDGAYV